MATFVRTVSVYVDGVDSPTEASALVGEANTELELADPEISVQIRLPDPDSGYEWEKVND